MNILIVNYLESVEGGAGRSTHLLARALKKIGHNVIIASTGIYPGISTKTFFKFRSIPFFGLRDVYLNLKLQKIIKEERIDVVHCSECRFGPVASIKAAQRFNIPAVIHYRGYWFNCLKGDLLYKMKEQCQGMKLGKCINCQSKSRMLWEIYKYLYFKKKIKILRQAHAHIAIHQERAKYLEIANITKNPNIIINPIKNFTTIDKEKTLIFKSNLRLRKIVISFVGKLIYFKGFKFFLELVLQSQDLLEDVTFFVVGDGELREFGERYININNIKNIIFFGVASEQQMDYIYSITDILLYPQIMSGFDRVPIEAMSAGIPVVSSDADGISELIDDKVNGYLLSLEDKQKWIEILKLLTDNPELRKKIGKNAKTRTSEYSAENHAKKIINIYESARKNSAEETSY